MSANSVTLQSAVDSSKGSDGVSISIYENEVPPFVEAGLEQLYENLYSSLIQLRVLGRAEHLSTYIAIQNNQTIALLLFRIERGRARVVNNVINIGEQEVARFAAAVFDRFGSINVVSFHAVETDVRQLAYPFQRFNSSENIVLTLPRAAEDYVASLGKNTRKNVKYYLNRLKRSFPSFEYKLLQKEQVSEAQVRDILRLKSGRLADKKMSSAIDDTETGRTLDLVKARGLVGIISIDGRVCAGSIGYRIGANSFGGVLAHDLEYDGYWIGMLCCYLTICECIALGCKEYHFLWGKDEYKYRMLGVERNLDDLTIYRSRTQMFLNAGTAFKALAKGYSRQGKLWLRDPKTRNNPVARLVARMMRSKPRPT